MPDIFSKHKRSAVMAAIRSRGNRATELRLIAVFRAQGITGWRRQVQIRGQKPEIRGQKAEDEARSFRVRPDFVFRTRRVAVFVDGCFWHGCPRHGTQPRQNAKFWRDKIARNRARDRLVTRSLRRADWTVLRVWEHELTRKNEGRLLRRLEPLMDANKR